MVRRCLSVEEVFCCACRGFWGAYGHLFSGAGALCCAIRFQAMAGEPGNDVSRIVNRGGDGHLTPVLLMLCAVAIWAIVPLAIDLSSGSLNPFLFGGGWRLGGAIGCGAFLLLRYPALLREVWSMIYGSGGAEQPETRQMVRDHFSMRRLNGLSLVYSAFGKFDYALFAIAAQSVAISVVAVIFEIWPIVMILLMGMLFRDDPQYRRTGLGLFSMLCLCFVGIAFVTLAGGANLFGTEWQFAGIALAVAAALAGGSKTAVLFKWGNILGRRLEDPAVTHETPDSLYTFGTLAGAVPGTVALRDPERRRRVRGRRAHHGQGAGVFGRGRDGVRGYRGRVLPGGPTLPATTWG